MIQERVFKITKVNSDFVSDDDLAIELVPHYVPPCSKLTYEADLQIDKSKILKLCKKRLIIVY